MKRTFITTIALFAVVGSLAAAQALVAPGHWSTETPLPAKRSEVSVAAAAGHVYVIGGYAEGNVDQPVVQLYDPATQTWSRARPLPQGLNHVGVIDFGGYRIYAFGGFRGQNRGAVADCNVYDSRTDLWSACTPLPTKRGSISVAVLGDKIHLVGGRDSASVTTHDVYDPATDSWASAAPLPAGEGRDHMGLLAYSGKLYAIGGRFNDFNHHTNLAEVYDPAKNAWSELPRMPTARSGGSAAVYHDRLLYIGGERGGGVFSENEAFDPATNTWSTLAPLPSGRHGTGAAVIGDKLYFPAGAPINGGGEQSDVLYVYTQP